MFQGSMGQSVVIVLLFFNVCTLGTFRAYRAHTGNYFPIGTRVKNRNPKNSVKYTQDSMHFVVGLQVNEHVFFNP